MKISDDYKAKIRLWASNPKVIALPKGPLIPKFSPQRFDSHEAMNRWKRELILRMARESGRD